MSDNTYDRFDIPFKTLELLIRKSQKEKAPAAAFYSGGGRNSIFRLEALCRICRKTNDQEIFDRWYKYFKKIEDLLGRIDYNDSMLKEFSTVQELKVAAVKLFGSELKKNLALLELELSQNGWLDGTIMQKFQDEIRQNVLNNADKERKEIVRFLIGEMEGLEKDYRKGIIDLTLLESGIHEFRRKLRWISIYAQSLNGLVQLREVKAMDEEQQKYCSPEITGSPFNQMPPVPPDVTPLLIQSVPFYALSWLVQFLGDLKDTGLRKEAFDKLVSVSKFDSKRSKDALIKKYNATLDFVVGDIPALAEYRIDLFLYRQGILRTLARDLNRNTQAEKWK